MPTHPIIPEIDVLIATAEFLVKRDVKPYKFSIPKGKGIDYETANYQLLAALIPHNIRPIHFDTKGQDVIGVSETEWWQVECKAFGSGEPSTHRDKFDRGLASVVSYYEEETRGLPQEYERCKNAKPYLGLALPASPEYLKHLKRGVRQTLRKRLNLWVLLYEPESKSIRAVAPEDSY